MDFARKLPEEPKTEVESLRVVNRNEAQEDGGSRAVFSRLVLLLRVYTILKRDADEAGVDPHLVTPHRPRHCVPVKWA